MGIESTVVSLGDSARVLRPGVISAEQISAVIGRAVIPWSPADAPTAESAASDHIASGSADGQAALESPGMLARHYAPRHEAVLIKRGREHEVGARLRAIARPVIALAWARTQATASPADVIEIAGASHPFGAAVGAARVIVVPCEPLAAARGLYDVLRRADEAAAALGAGAVICVETPQVEGGGPDAHVWGAILDRLTRACTRA